MSVRRTSLRLADGREIIYFDDSPAAPPREAVDTRPLGERARAGQLRYDALVGDWVAVAGHRLNRTFLPPKDECPLCPTGTGSVPSEVPETSYDVVVFENRFPSFAQSAPDVPSEIDGNPLWPQRPAVGRCEVVCFTSDHNAAFGSLPVSRVRTVIEAWADRTAALSALPGVEQVFPFENRGQEIGVTLQHPHGQIYGYPFVTPRTAQLLTRAASHRQRTGRDLMGDVLDGERKSGARVVLDGEAWTCFVPAAARWPVEAHLVPHRVVPDFAALDDTERDELAVLYRDLLYRLERVFGEPMELPYIAGWHQAPIHTGRDLTRLHLQLFSLRRAPGKLKFLAGSESGMAAWINDVTPEQIAERLRAAGS
jgi:UDPglucose--hexose-1-phosphate uridylyltransferase